MSILQSLLQKYSSVKNVCLLFVLSHLILLSMMVFTFPKIHKQIGTQAFDLQTFGYSVSVAETIINNLDSQTTQLYLFPQLTLLDLFYPFLLALFLSSFLFRLVNTNSKSGSLLLIIPFLAMVFDYLENICIVLMITKSIEISKWFVFTSSSFTVLKSILTSTAWLTLLIFIIKWLILTIKKSSLKNT